jgi:hypothetical protein
MPETAGAAIRKPRGTVTGAPLAEVSAGWERSLGSDPRDPIPTTDTAEFADADVLVARPDLGPDRYTLILAGDRLPSRTELSPPAQPAPSAAAKVRKVRQVGFWRRFWYGSEHERAAELTLAEVLAEDLPNTPAGVTVTSETAPKLAAVWGCVRLLADVVSTLPIDVYRTRSRDPVDPPLPLVRPAAGMDVGEWL